MARERGVGYAALSRLLGRNPAYVQQFIKRGSPRKLEEADRGTLARFFGVAESALGGPAGIQVLATGRDGERGRPTTLIPIPRLNIDASAGSGAFNEHESASV